MALTSTATEIERGHLWNRTTLFSRVSQGCLAFAVENGKGGMQDGNYITQKAALVWAADTHPMTTRDRAGTSRSGGGRTSDDLPEADGRQCPSLVETRVRAWGYFLGGC